MTQQDFANLLISTNHVMAQKSSFKKGRLGLLRLCVGERVSDPKTRHSWNRTSVQRQRYIYCQSDEGDRKNRLHDDDRLSSREQARTGL